MKNDIQKMYDHCIQQIKEATALEKISNAGGKPAGEEVGKRLAYSDIARRLVSAGAQAMVIMILLFAGCCQTTAHVEDDVMTITRTRFLITEDIGSVSFDATDGSFTIDGYKSDMTKALELVKYFAALAEGKDAVMP